MEGRSTDHKNLNLAKLHRDVIKGTAGGKIIWQPRIGCWLQDKLFAGEKLPEPYDGMTLPEIYKELGCSARIYDYNGCFVAVDDQRVRRYSRNINERQIENVVETPVGKITQIIETSLNSWASYIKKWWITSEEDMKVAMWIAERQEWKWNQEHYDRTYKEWGDLGAPTIFMPRVNVQHLFVDVMGVENAIYAIYDYPKTVEKYFQILDENHDRLIDVINESPIDIINFGDNVHAGTLSPNLFKKYVLPSYQRRCEKLHRAGKFVHAHWDGDVKPLLPYVQECGLDGIEAVTPVPQGDVTLEEVKQAFGDKMFLIDGIAAILFDKTFSEDDLIKQAKEVIDLFAPKLILGISDELSSTGDINRIKIVGQIVDNYNARISNK
ncbi:Uroporphyrinogen decarboxylase (URO-D) [Caldanaerobius fijiensis DSM 17918]|uniref:Uroporphyrinogen decarboxylase (URO-D) n=1 Tax=Caldanaerobius fijiensis DSM 17918 TaxID=1121256 RepID=A0A1M4Y412_9THEO|nr:uroporphyrinogen decarboxylase family protein [Caldanaerobius fijiensis]SHF00346.1 Uroporphyrinogen decarboxylase (URO-D) [Caldanaerobius fijiensis DSM 17918]